VAKMDELLQKVQISLQQTSVSQNEIKIENQTLLFLRKLKALRSEIEKRNLLLDSDPNNNVELVKLSSNIRKQIKTLKNESNQWDKSKMDSENVQTCLDYFNEIEKMEKRSTIVSNSDQENNNNLNSEVLKDTIFEEKDIRIDKNLDIISSHLQITKNQAINLSNEIDNQTNHIEIIKTKTEKVQDKLDSTNKSLIHIAKNLINIKKDHFICYVFLFIIFISIIGFCFRVFLF
jgi:hypothetical protein